MLDPKALLAYCESELDALVHCLRQAVEIESPSQNPAAIDRMANFFAQEFSQRGAKVQLLSHATAGSAVVAEFWEGARGTKPILLLGHLDTVWEIGTLAEMPFQVQRGARLRAGNLRHEIRHRLRPLGGAGPRRLENNSSRPRALFLECG